jgi:hypothetical protein
MSAMNSPTIIYNAIGLTENVVILTVRIIGPAKQHAQSKANVTDSQVSIHIGGTCTLGSIG